MQLRSIIGFAAGPIATAALGLITAPVIAWIFSPEDIGRLNILQVCLSFTLLLTVLGLDQAYVREYHESIDKPRLLLTCFAPGFSVLILLLGATLPFSSELSLILFDSENPWLFVLLASISVLNYISRFLSLILRLEERGWAFSASQILPKILQLALVGGIATWTIGRDFTHLAGITAISFLTVTVIYSWSTRKEWLPATNAKFQLAELKPLLRFGFPLIFSGLAYWGLTATSTFALRTWSSLEQLAVYSLANSFAGAAIVFQSIFTVIWAPTVYKWVSQGVDMKIIDTVAQQALAVLGAIVALSGSLSWLCDLLLPQQYTDVKYVLLCMLMPPLLYTLSEVTCVGIAIKRRTIYSLWITLAALATNVFLSFLLVPPYGAAGAAVANATAFTVFFVARTEVSARIWLRFPRIKLYAWMAALLTATSLTTFFSDAIAPVSVHGVWAGLLLVLVFNFRAQWMQILAAVRGHGTKVDNA